MGSTPYNLWSWTIPIFSKIEDFGSRTKKQHIFTYKGQGKMTFDSYLDLIMLSAKQKFPFPDQDNYAISK